MEPYTVAKEIIIKSIKKWYLEECSQRSVEKIIGDDLQGLIENLYNRKEEVLKKKIRKGIVQLCNEEKYGGAEGIDNIITDIFGDEELAKKRVKYEIELM